MTLLRVSTVFGHRKNFSLETWKISHVLERFEMFQENLKIGRSDNLEFGYSLKMKALAVLAKKQSFALKNFANFTRKHQCWRPFLMKLHAFRSTNVLKETPTQVFPVKFAKFLRAPFFTEPFFLQSKAR